MERSSFFNSISGDRRYKAEDWARYFASFIGNGVFPQPSNGLQVAAGVGMNVIVRPGKAWINGYFYENDSELILPLPTADGVLKRIDRVVLRWDLTGRNIKAKIKSSPPASSPTPPILQRDADAYEICLGDTTINAGVTSISNTNIAEKRFDPNLCGIVTGVVQQIDFSSITAQFDSFFELYRQLITQRYGVYNADITTLQSAADQLYQAFVASLQDYLTDQKQTFDVWFATIQDLLSGEVAGDFALEITSLKARVAVLEQAIANIPVYATEAWLGNSYSGSAYLSTI